MSNEYNLGDTFHVDSTLTFDLDSEDYLNKSKTDKEYQDKYKINGTIFYDSSFDQ